MNDDLPNHNGAMDTYNIYEEVVRGRKPNNNQNQGQTMQLMYQNARRKIERIVLTSDTPHPRLSSPRIDNRNSEEHMRNAHRRGLMMEKHVRDLYDNIKP